MTVVFDDRVIADLRNIRLWIAESSCKSARTVIDRLVSDVYRLVQFPGMGRPGALAGTREWVVPKLPYVIVYEVDQITSVLTVTAIFHTARKR